jgi:hypothetical protein
MSWEELKRTLAKTIELMPSSDEEHAARIEAMKQSGEQVVYLRRPNYCGGWDQWTKQTSKETGALEIVRVRRPTGLGASCWDTPTPGTSQCSSCRSRERESFEKYSAWLKGQRGEETATKAGRYMPKGMS